MQRIRQLQTCRYDIHVHEALMRKKRRLMPTSTLSSAPPCSLFGPTPLPLVPLTLEPPNSKISSSTNAFTVVHATGSKASRNAPFAAGMASSGSSCSSSLRSLLNQIYGSMLHAKCWAATYGVKFAVKSYHSSWLPSTKSTWQNTCFSSPSVSLRSSMQSLMSPAQSMRCGRGGCTIYCCKLHQGSGQGKQGDAQTSGGN